MDPLSVTASIVATLQITATLISYLNDIRQASKVQANLAVEVGNIYALLINLRFRVEMAQSNDSWFNQVKLLAAPGGSLVQLDVTLRSMAAKLGSTTGKEKIKNALTWKFTQTEVGEALVRIERLKSLINIALLEDHFALSQAIQSDVSVIKEGIVKLGTSNHHLAVDLAAWLRTSDVSSNYHAALKKRQKGTCRWLIDSREFCDWKTKPSTIWLHGIPGCGKTVLSAAALEDIEMLSSGGTRIAIAYFYFDFNDSGKQSLQSLVRSLVSQLANQVSGGVEELKKLYSSCQNGRAQPSEETLDSLLDRLLKASNSTYVVIDALDECTDREELLEQIKSTCASHQSTLHLLMTSRREKDLNEGLSSIVIYKVDIQNSVVDEDIRLFVEQCVAQDSKLKKWPPKVRDDISETLTHGAQGMFQWAFCQMDSIRKCMKLNTLRTTLSSLPKSLDQTYERILSSLEDEQLHDALLVLQLLCFAVRPLKLNEVVEMLAIDFSSNEFSSDQRYPDPQDVWTLCSSLISIEVSELGDYNTSKRKRSDNLAIHNGSASNMGYTPAFGMFNSDFSSRYGTVRLAHYSVQEYLLSGRSAFAAHFTPEVGHSRIGKGCLIYLQNACALETLPKSDPAEFRPLAAYSADCWWRHIEKFQLSLDEHTTQSACDVLTNRVLLMAWLRLCSPFTLRHLLVDNDIVFGEPDSALSYASSLGITQIVDVLIAAGHDANGANGNFRSPLKRACLSGNNAIVKSLLSAGAEVNAADRKYSSSPLSIACQYRDADTVQLLLGAGADVNVTDSGYSSPLSITCRFRDADMVQLLLNAGADVNTADRRYSSSPLSIVCRFRDADMVQLLLNAGADVNARLGKGQLTLLHRAVARPDCEELVKILIEAGADVNATGLHSFTPLHAAAMSGRSRIVRLLLEAGAEIETGGESTIPLSCTPVVTTS